MQSNKKLLKSKIQQKTEQEIQPLLERHKQLKSKLDQAAHDPLSGKIQLAGRTFSFDTSSGVKKEIAEIEQQLAVIKEQNIKTVTHNTLRAFKELPHFFKFPLIKTHPRRPIAKTSLGQDQFEPITETINFQQVKAEITYYAGELGDQDRMVWLAVINQAIRNREFVKEFGWIPYSREDIANEIGLIDTAKKKKISESLKRLQHTFVDFKSKFGSFAFNGAFHLLDSVASIESKKVRNDINNRLQSNEKNLPDPIITQEFATQAKAMLERIKPKTPKINLIRFHANLMDAILSHQITTIDLWAIKNLSPTEKTLFLYLYDISQWRESNDLLKLTIIELVTLLCLKPNIYISKGKEYVEWNRSKKQIGAAMIVVETTLKHVISHFWNGDGEKSVLLVQFVKNVKQIPSRSE